LVQSVGKRRWKARILASNRRRFNAVEEVCGKGTREEVSAGWYADDYVKGRRLVVSGRRKHDRSKPNDYDWQIAMQFSDTDSVIAVDAELRDAMLHILPTPTPEERLQGLAPDERLQGLAPEERLQGLAPEERLKGLAPEERLKGLSPSERRKLRELLDQTEEGSVAEDH
jgi:hypothetical protein